MTCQELSSPNCPHGPTVQALTEDRDALLALLTEIAPAVECVRKIAAQRASEARGQAAVDMHEGLDLLIRWERRVAAAIHRRD